MDGKRILTLAWRELDQLLWNFCGHLKLHTLKVVETQLIYSMVPDKNRTVFIRNSGPIHPSWFLWTMFFSFSTLWFLFRPCFSLQSPCCLYSDTGFSKYYIKSATVISDLRLVIPLWFLSGPRFSGSVQWGFYKEWDFYFLPPVVLIQAMVLQSLPMMFLFCPCAQSGTIEYVTMQ